MPAAVWLLGQAPQKSGHGHEHHAEEEHSDGGTEEQSQGKAGDDSKAEDQGEAEDSKDESKDESKDDGKQDDKSEGQTDDSGSDSDDGKDTPQTSDDEKYEPSSPGTLGQTNKNPRKGPGEGQKGERRATEKKGEKDVRNTPS